MNGSTVQKSQFSLRTIISTIHISLGFSDTPVRVGYLQIFSVIRGLSPTRKSEKRVFYEIVWTSMVYLLLLNCTHRGPDRARLIFSLIIVLISRELCPSNKD